MIKPPNTTGNTQPVPVAATPVTPVARGPVKAVRIDLTAGASVEDAFSALVRACVAQMQANERGLLAGRNAEYLHQFRVGLRRLRSAIQTYRPVLEVNALAALNDEISWLSNQLGAARDWDVLLGDIIAPLLRSEPHAPGLDALRRRCALQRRSCGLAARAAIASPRYDALRLQLEEFAAAPRFKDDARAEYLRNLPLRAFAAKRLAGREKAARLLAEGLADADSGHRHSLRIAAKKLRYGIEFFQALFPRKKSRAYASALSAMQDALGLLNDGATARRLLSSVDHGRDPAADAAARGLVLGWIVAQEHFGMQGLAAGHATWRAQKRFWKPALPEKPPLTPPPPI